MKTAAPVLIFLLFASCLASFAADNATVIYVEGEVTMNDSAVSVGDNVLPGATIKTEAEALCEVVFNKKNIIHMTGGTVLTFDPKVLSRGATLQKGAIGMVLRNLGPFG